MKNRLLVFFQRIKTAATRPMTQHQYDFMLAMAGAKRCPHCQKWLHSGSGSWEAGPR